MPCRAMPCHAMPCHAIWSIGQVARQAATHSLYTTTLTTTITIATTPIDNIYSPSPPNKSTGASRH
jgi:hypothetical protein